AFRCAPEDRSLRRRAAGRLRAAQRWLDLLEVLRAEAAGGDRVTGLLDGARLLAGPLGEPRAALAWAEDALRAAREMNRAPEAARAAELCATLEGMPGPEAEPAP